MIAAPCRVKDFRTGIFAVHIHIGTCKLNVKITTFAVKYPQSFKLIITLSVIKIRECTFHTVILGKKPAVIIVRHEKSLIFEALKDKSVIRKSDSSLMTGIPVHTCI